MANLDDGQTQTKLKGINKGLFDNKWKELSLSQRLQVINRQANMYGYKFFLLNEKDEKFFVLDKQHKVLSIKQKTLEEDNTSFVYAILTQMQDLTFDEVKEF